MIASDGNRYWICKKCDGLVPFDQSKKRYFCGKCSETLLPIPHNFTPREYQLPVWAALENGIKRVVLTWHRRSGKDFTILNWCVKRLYMEVCTCFYIMPSYAQAKKVIWDAIDNDGRRLLDCIPPQIIAQKNNQEMKVRFRNGSLLQLIGSDNIDSLMGTNPRIVVFSEYALQDPAAWDYIRPILKVNKGVAIFISTPRGRNHFYDLYKGAERNQEWFRQKLSIEDTEVLTAEDVKQEMADGMSEELALQEYYCSFDRGVEGSFYSQILARIADRGKVCQLEYDPYKLVHTAWDLGWNDATAIIFFQIVDDQVRIIDCEESGRVTLEGWKKVLDDRKYKYGTHLFPHDVEHVDGLHTGATRRELLEELGISVTNVPKTALSDGITATQALLESRVMINNKKCEQLLKCLDHYHREWDDVRKAYANKPVHDWSSHFCDALRYLACGLSKVQGASKSSDSDYKALQAFWG